MSQSCAYLFTRVLSGSDQNRSVYLRSEWVRVRQCFGVCCVYTFVSLWMLSPDFQFLLFSRSFFVFLFCAFAFFLRVVFFLFLLCVFSGLSASVCFLKNSRETKTKELQAMTVLARKKLSKSCSRSHVNTVIFLLNATASHFHSKMKPRRKTSTILSAYVPSPTPKHK